MDNRNIFCVSPIPIARRNLHREQPKKGGIRSRYSGTVLVNGLIKNTLVKHIKYGLTKLAGINAKGLFSIYSIDGKRLTIGAKQNDFRVLTRLNFNYNKERACFPCLKERGFQLEDFDEYKRRLRRITSKDIRCSTCVETESFLDRICHRTDWSPGNSDRRINR